jgi:hypothetical protein
LPFDSKTGQKIVQDFGGAVGIFPFRRQRLCEDIIKKYLRGCDDGRCEEVAVERK